ncbi:uncharacterized protein LOC135688506 [Rhopilema esculentum]|uniref:uncharacterized protein LOC135688506 n=1 Tax=Rhopilema esculentum TaxID=499914 RepID=UPI0031D70D09
MNLYLDRKRIAFILLSFLSLLFSLICTFAKGWSTYRGASYGLFSPDIKNDNVCGALTDDNSSCLHWFRAAQACMLLGLLSHILTFVGLVLAETRNFRFWLAGTGEFAVGTFTILALIVYSFQSPYQKGVPLFDLGWAFKLAWTIGFFSLVAAVIGISDGTKAEGVKL